ncbi:reverse transcriptase domain-containing protein [Tanacetum coccineum]
MAKEDQEKTAFITSQGIFCYSKMPFGLKNAEATYQRLVDKAFQKQISRKLEVYVDDLVIKSRTEHEIIRDIDKTFKTLKEINMKLNPKKCTFGIEEVKGQILSDFIVERPEDDPLDTPVEAEEELSDPWTLFTNGSPYVDGSGAGLILINPEGVEFTYALRFRFDASNNEAEYEALIADLRITKQMEELKEKSINKVEVLAVVEEEGDTWMTPIYNYLAKEELPADKKKGRAIRRKSGRYAVINEVLYKKSCLGPWLRCVGPLQANYVLREIHERSCSMHARTRSVVAKAIRTWYYWLIMHAGARKIIRECQDFQVHRPVPRNPQHKLTPIMSPWPFYKWRIDIAETFPKGPGKVKFLIVAMDHFTKWIEARHVATITSNRVKKFVWDNIVCKFGLPGEIISDNGKQFRDNPFKDWCEKLCIRQRFAFVKHPQANGLVERANKSLGEGIKERLDERCKDWIKEIPHVLWAHRIMIKSSNRDTPFSLTYGTEAVIPAEIGMPTLRTAKIDMVQNDEALKINLDLLEERREQAAIREARSKANMENGKLSPKWEGPYEVTEALEKGHTSSRTAMENFSANLERP